MKNGYLIFEAKDKKKVEIAIRELQRQGYRREWNINFLDAISYYHNFIFIYTAEDRIQCGFRITKFECVEHCLKATGTTALLKINCSGYEVE